MKNYIIFSIFLLALWSCKGAKDKPKTEATTDSKPKAENTIQLTQAQFNNSGITTTTIANTPIATALKLNGKIDVPPQNLVSVSVPLGGYLQKTHLLQGMPVHKGEVLATIEDKQYVQIQQDYLLAKSKLHYAELDYKRQKDLNQSQASSDKVMQQAMTEMNIQRINMQALAEQLRLININPSTLTSGKITKQIHIYSPINGFVSKVNVNIGKYVNPTEVLFELVNPTDFHLALKVFEKDINQLAIGQTVTAYTNVNPEKKYPCKIILISRDIDEAGASEVHCHFENYDKSLVMGMYMNAEVETHAANINALPEDCVVNFEGKNFVFVQDKPLQYSMIEVQLGTHDNGYVTILNDAILKNKTIVQKGAYHLLMTLKNGGEEE